MEGTKDGAALLEGGIVGSSASDASKTMATSGRFEVAKSSTATVGVWMLKGEEETGAMRTSLVTPDLFGPIVVRIVGDGLGHAVGDAVGNVAVTVGSSVNAKEGLTDGDLEGLALGLLDGSKLGDVLGVEVLAVGRELGRAVGTLEGLCEGSAVGSPLGRSLGLELGLLDGDRLGSSLGWDDGCAEGLALGLALGRRVGLVVGLAVGFFVGFLVGARLFGALGLTVPDASDLRCVVVDGNSIDSIRPRGVGSLDGDGTDEMASQRLAIHCRTADSPLTSPSSCTALAAASVAENDEHTTSR